LVLRHQRPVDLAVTRHRRLVDLAVTREADMEALDLKLKHKLQLLLALGVVDLPLDHRHHPGDYLELRHPHPVALVVAAVALGPRPHQVRLERQLQPQEACLALLLPPPPPQEGGCMELRRRAGTVVRKWHPLLSPHDRMDPRQSI
jgi:hypothetical protein